MLEVLMVHVYFLATRRVPLSRIDSPRRADGLKTAVDWSHRSRAANGVAANSEGVTSTRCWPTARQPLSDGAFEAAGGAELRTEAGSG